MHTYLHAIMDDLKIGDEMALNRNTTESDEASPVSIIRLFSSEILVTVFEFLDVRSKGRAARVCRTWRAVMNVHSVWKYVEISRLSPSSLFDIYVRRGMRRILSPARLPNIARIEEWLQQVADFSTFCDGVAEVTISVELSCTFNNLTAESLFTVIRATSALRITTIKLTECWCVTNSFFTAIAVSCPNLVVLMLFNTLYRIRLYNVLDGEPVWNALVKLRQLRCFGLLGWNITDSFFEYLVNDPGENIAATDDIIDQRARRAPLRQLMLTNLQLKGCSNITNKSLGYISMTMPRLVQLCLDDSDGITYEGMSHLTALKELRALTLPCLRPTIGGGIKLFSATDDSGANYNDIGVSSLATSGVLGRLEGFYVVGITDISMGVIARYTHRSDEVTGRLVELQLRNAGVTDQGMTSLISNSSTTSTLRSLSLFQCWGITGDSIRRLATSVQLVDLTHLNLMRCSQLDDASLDHVANGFPSLRHLSLRECSFTNDGIHRLVLGCRRLTSLDISHIHRLTARCLTQISRHLEDLERIIICGKNYRRVVATKGFKNLLNLPRLKAVGLTVRRNYDYECLSGVVNQKMRYVWA